MFTRLRWFVYGFLASLGATAYVLTRLRRMRERLTPQSVARVSALGLADAMAVAGRRLAGDANRRHDESATERNRELAAG